MVLTVRTILHIFVESGRIKDAGEALAKMPEIILEVLLPHVEEDMDPPPRLDDARQNFTLDR